VKEAPSEPLVLVEGFFGCMKFWQAGAKRTASLMGWSISDIQAALIIEAAKSQGHVIVVFDEDEAGREAREKAVNRLASDLFVKTLKLGRPGLQPDMLTPAEIAGVLK
jgi:DNA primase